MFVYKGKVKKGAQRGRELGFPTANIALHKNIPEGIYVSEVIIHQNRHSERSKGSQATNNKKSSRQARTITYQAATFVGKSETFNEKEYKSESFLLDFSGDLYEKWITVHLLKKLRDNRKFDSSEALVKQMKQDILTTREFFSQFK